MKIQVNPNVLLRISGNDTKSFLSWVNTFQIDSVFHHLILLDKEIELLKVEVCDALYNQIKSTNDSMVQNELLNFKRFVFNDGLKKNTSTIDFTKESFKSSIICIQRLQDLYALKNDRIKLFSDSYEQLVAASRLELKNLALNPQFQNGLLLSSESLYLSLQKYFFSTVGINKKYLNTERSILKYLTRFYTKTSPFSSFTNVGMLPAHSNPKPDISAKGMFHSSSIRINSYILKYLLDVIFSISDLCKVLPLRLNPSIVEEGTSYKYLVNNYLAESFQTLAKSSVIDFLSERVSSSCSTICDLAKQLMAAVGEPENVCLKFIFKLIDYGFFEYVVDVSSMNKNWDAQLFNFLNAKKFEETLPLTILKDILFALTNGKEKFERTKSVSVRYDILSETYSILQKECHRLMEFCDRKPYIADGSGQFVIKPMTKFYFRLESIFYEDTVVETNYEIDETWLADNVHKLERLCQHLDFFDIFLPRRLKLLKFFKSNYKDDGKVDFLSFYEDYCKDIRNNDHSVLYEDDTAREKLEFLKSLSKYFENLTKQEGEINLSSQELDLIAQPYKVVGRSNGFNSRAVFYQIVGDKTNAKMVVNTPSIGFGRMVSRFLHLFDKSVTSKFLDENMSLSKDFLFVENCDGSFFNGNIHPELMNNEVAIPGSNNIAPLKNQVKVRDIAITVINDELALYHKITGKRIFMFDLGFQGAGRTPIFQMLNLFTVPQNIFSPIISALEIAMRTKNEIASFEDAVSIIKLPRIVYERTIILQRKTWIIPMKVIPKKGNVDDPSYFTILNAWRIEHSIPTEIFFFVKPNRWEKQKEDDKGRSFGKDDYKPQYINFSNPLLVGLFSEMLLKGSKYIKFEEMSPNFEESQIFEDKKYITEFVAHWNVE